MTPLTASANAFASLVALRAAHTDLLKRLRAEGESPELLATVEQFLARGVATGTLLVEEEDRWTAQSLLDYWNTTLYRAGTPTADTALADFDPRQAPELDDSMCPYLGLDAFSEAHADMFFGRRRLVAEVVERLGDQRLLAIGGPSGSGKSSFVRAGLIPALSSGAVSGSDQWRILPPLVPGSAPLDALDRALNAAPSGSPAQPLLIVIDQFEETFTLCTDEAQRSAFFIRLVELTSDQSLGHRVIITMRSDFESYVARAEIL